VAQLAACQLRPGIGADAGASGLGVIGLGILAHVVLGCDGSSGVPMCGLRGNGRGLVYGAARNDGSTSFIRRHLRLPALWIGVVMFLLVAGLELSAG
jgi:hypothetical protein